MSESIQVSSPFRQIVRSRRAQLGLSQRQLARAVGWKNPEMVSQIENGDKFPSLNVVPRLAIALCLGQRELCILAASERYPAFAIAIQGQA